MTPIAIDVGIGDTLQAINGILKRRESDRAERWELLNTKLQAVLRAVDDLDSMYLALLAEIEDIFAQPQPVPERITDAIHQAAIYCTDERLTLCLVEAQGEIQAAAFSRDLKPRRYRHLVSTLRSIDDPLEKYINRLKRLQAGNAPKVPAQDKDWNLRTVLELLKLITVRLAANGDVGEDLPDPKDACEEANRNYRRALSIALTQLIGLARQDLAMEGL